MSEELTTIDASTLTPDPGPAKLPGPAPRGRPDIDQLTKIAQMMAHSSFVPKHLVWKTDPVRTVANCFLVVNQAAVWGMDPFAVASESYVVAGRLSFSGKLIAGLINARAGLKERLKASFSNTGAALQCTVSGTFKGEKTERAVTLIRSQVQTSNDLWKTDPEQKLFYSTAVKWARRHCPELILGICTVEDSELITGIATPTEPPAQEVIEDEPTPAAAAATNGQPMPPPIQENQTLQEALAAQPTPINPDKALDPDAKADATLFPRIVAARDLLFTQLGMGNDPIYLEARKKAWQQILALRGATSIKDMKNSEVLTLEFDLNRKAEEVFARKQAANEKK